MPTATNRTTRSSCRRPKTPAKPSWPSSKSAPRSTRAAEKSAHACPPGRAARRFAIKCLSGDTHATRRAIRAGKDAAPALLFQRKPILASKPPASSAIRTTGTAATPRGDDRQTQLLQIACRFFARYGYKGTSLRDIAEEAQITKAALYYHFPNKNSLYERIVLEGVRVLVDEVSEATARATSARDKLRAFMMTTAEIYVRDPDQWTAGSNAFWVDEDSVPRNAAIDLRDRYEKLLRACITQGVESGEFKNVDPALAGRVVLSVINGLSRWFRPGGRLTIAQVIDQYLDIILG